MLSPMNFLLESANHVPVNIAIGVIVFLILVGAMALLHGFGASRPHS